MEKDKKYIYEIRLIEMLFLPPLAICHIIFGKDFNYRIKSGLFLIIWTLLQWLYFLVIETNILTKIATANLGVFLFYYLNMYISLDSREMSEDDKMIFNSISLKLFVTLTCFFMMYSSPRMIHKMYAGLAGKTIIWTKQNIGIALVLVCSWFAFLMIDKYKTFDQFPKPEDKDGLHKLIPLRDNIIKIYGIYSILIFFFLFYVYIL